MIKRITRKPPRWKENDSIYFLTMCTHGRKPYLHHLAVPEMLTENLNFYSKKIKELIAFTIMPDHIHLLIEIKDSGEMSDFLRDFKRYTSKEIKRIVGVKNNHVWQRGTMDHCIRESDANEDFENHLHYLFFNSVKHLGVRPRDYPYHNFKDIVNRGWLDEDFYNIPEKELKEFEIYE